MVLRPRVMLKKVSPLSCHYAALNIPDISRWQLEQVVALHWQQPVCASLPCLQCLMWYKALCSTSASAPTWTRPNAPCEHPVVVSVRTSETFCHYFYFYHQNAIWAQLQHYTRQQSSTQTAGVWTVCALFTFFDNFCNSMHATYHARTDESYTSYKSLRANTALNHTTMTCCLWPSFHFVVGILFVALAFVVSYSNNNYWWRRLWWHYVA